MGPSRAFATVAGSRFSRLGLVGGILSLGGVVGCFALMEPKHTRLFDHNSVKKMTIAEIHEMVDEGRIVVSFKGGVYDVTDFTGHPGGVGRLQMVAGMDLEPFWNVYTQHNRGHVTNNILQRYKIGTLSDAEAEIQKNVLNKFDHPYSTDPPMKPELLTNTRFPYNAEARLRDLTESWITPISRHFVRNHSHVPDIDPEAYVLTVEGAGLITTTFTLTELKKFPKHEVSTVIQCNGNRREDYHFLVEGEPAFGPPHWVAGAIGCSTWTGVRLRDVLRAAGMDVDALSLGKTEAPAGSSSIGLTGYDTDEVSNPYCCSIPFEKGIDPFGDVILAYEMNGEAVPREHGFPVRAIVPGSAGARNCKYLAKVEVTDEPCKNECNWKQYAVHSSEVTVEQLCDFSVHKKCLSRDPPVQEMPVQSMITVPSPGDTLSLNCASNRLSYDDKTGQFSVKVKGLAWGGGGSGINRVDVSLDGGDTFTRAELLDNPIKQRRGSQWGWVFFEKEVPVSTADSFKLKRGLPVHVTLTSKALNTEWNVQPEFAKANRNPHGCCVNHWYRVPVQLDPKAHDCTRAHDGDFANKPSGGNFTTPFRNLAKPCACPHGNCPPGRCMLTQAARVGGHY